MRTYLTILLILFAIFNSALVRAIELGTHGGVWPIEERDMRDVMAEELMRADLGGINKQLTDSAHTFFERLPQAGLPRAEETRTRWIDPGMVLASEIKAPVKNEAGEWEWRVLHPAGTRVNPLEQVQPVDRLLFFNAEDEDEVAFVKAVLKLHPVDVMPVATGGNIKPMAEKLDRPIFFARADLIERFAIKATPTLVGSGKGVLSLYLAVTEIRLPAKATLVKQAWFGLTDAEAKALATPKPAKARSRSAK